MSICNGHHLTSVAFTFAISYALAILNHPPTLFRFTATNVADDLAIQQCNLGPSARDC